MKRFRKVYVEITNICNKHCSFCPDTKRAKAFMSVESFDIVASKISKYTDYIYLHVKGEPLLHPNLDKILEGLLFLSGDGLDLKLMYHFIVLKKMIKRR